MILPSTAVLPVLPWWNLRRGSPPFLAQVVRRRLRQRGNKAESACIRDRGDKLRPADPLHAALDDRVLDPEQFGESGFDHFLSPSMRSGGLRGPALPISSMRRF